MSKGIENIKQNKIISIIIVTNVAGVRTALQDQRAVMLSQIWVLNTCNFGK